MRKVDRKEFDRFIEFRELLIDRTIVAGTIRKEYTDCNGMIVAEAHHLANKKLLNQYYINRS